MPAIVDRLAGVERRNRLAILADRNCSGLGLGRRWTSAQRRLRLRSNSELNPIDAENLLGYLVGPTLNH